MTEFLCTACGTQYPDAERPPPSCPICDDERQFVPPGGQSWTTVAELSGRHEIVWREEAPGIHTLTIAPHFAIGQRAFLIETAHGNVLWDCIALVDDSAVARIRRMGGLAAIAISHPHFHSTMGAWSAALGGVPIHLHADNGPWIRKPDPAVSLWSGETLQLTPDMTLVRCGGHFPGSTVLHWASGQGSLFTGDTMQVVPDRRHVSFMYAYPNLIPLDAPAVKRIVDAVAPYGFDRVFGGFAERTIASDGKAAVERSAARYLRAIGEGMG